MEGTFNPYHQTIEFVNLIVVITFARYFLEFFLPKQIRNYYNNLVIKIRMDLIEFATAILDKSSLDKTNKDTNDTYVRNFELTMVIHIIFPFYMILHLHSILFYMLDTWVYGKMILLGYFLFLFEVYLFLNISPTLQDWEILFHSHGNMFWFGKLLLIFMYFPILPDIISWIFILVPISLVFPNYRPETYNKKLTDYSIHQI